MGLSVEGLRNQIREEGLLSVLGTLRVAMDGNSDAADLFPNVRALRGILDLTGAGAEHAAEIFQKLSKAQGSTAEAFKRTEESASFKLQRSLNSAKESFKEVGMILLNQLLPPLTGLLNMIKNAFTAFTNLDGGTQKLIAGLGLISLALPTLISLFGTLSGIVAALMTPAVAIAGVLAGIAYIIYKNWSEVGTCFSWFI